ncbi:MAG: hypothetical protein KA106_03540 [Ferrovibrio sp.]|nr:hypothetical protein [Ferrovibrio sp.]
MADATVWGSEVKLLADRIDLGKRLVRFGITATTRQNLRLVQPILSQHLVGITGRFYDFIHRFPEAQSILMPHDSTRLRQSLHRHWLVVFDCQFDRDYLVEALGVGHAHYRAKVPPTLYMAGYNFFLGDLLRLAALEFKGGDMAAATASISRVINLDMSLALTAFLVDTLRGAETL